MLPGALLLVFPLLAWASSGSVSDYAPSTNVQCPDSSSLVRVWTPENQTLHPQEIDYIDTRAKTVLPDAWKAWLGDQNARHGYNISVFEGHFPKVGMAIPGGGLRAALYGAGCISGLDARNDSAKAAGTGGLLQVTSYMTGLSGGSWITGSLFFNDWPTIHEMVLGDGKGHEGWMLDIPFVTPDGINILTDQNQAFFGAVLTSVDAKSDAGINTSMTDVWARMISYHFLNETTRSNFYDKEVAHGAGQLWSQIPRIPAYQQFQTPFPIVVADSRPVGSNLTTILPLNSTVYEITPLELASYDPSLSAGMNLSYAGTDLTNGKPENASSCVTGFDEAGFVMGTSASLFNQIFDFAHNTFTSLADSDTAGLLYFLKSTRSRADEVANWPNPFNGLKNSTFQDTNSKWLELVDGATNQENVPYAPLFVKARGLDVIVTIEASSDHPQHGWPNGSSPVTTALRQRTFLESSHQQFPPIPETTEKFVSTGVNMRATFFGCDPQETPAEYPLVIYLPNAPPFNGEDPVTNTATFSLMYTRKHVDLFLTQAHRNTISGFIPNANTSDANFGTCLQCAAIDRARYKVIPVVPRSDACTECFKQYCYDPQNPPSLDALPGRKLAFVDPDPVGLKRVGTFLDGAKLPLIGGAVGLVVFIAAMIGGLLWWKKRRTRQQQQAYKRVDDTFEDTNYAPLTKNYLGALSHSQTESHELTSSRMP